MIGLFSDIFTARENLLVRQDSRVKLAVAGALLALALLSHSLTVPLSLGGLSLGVAAALRVPMRLLLVRMMPPILLAGAVLVLKGLFGRGEIIWQWGAISLHREGLAAGLSVASRVTGATAIMILLSATTPAHRVFSALAWLGVPATWTEVAMLMYRYIFVLIEQAMDVAAAQRTRLGYATRARALRSVGALGGLVCVRSIDQAVRISQAMMIRGYRGTMPCAPMPALRGADVMWMVLAWAICAGVLIMERWQV